MACFKDVLGLELRGRAAFPVSLVHTAAEASCRSDDFQLIFGLEPSFW